MDGFVLAGYPLEGRLTADWLVTEDEVRIRITGFPIERIRGGTFEGDPEVVARSEMPIAYQAEIILRNAERKGNGETHKATEGKEQTM